MRSQGTLCITVATSVAAFALGFQLGQEEPNSAPGSLDHTLTETPFSETALPVSVPPEVASPTELPIPLQLLEEADFESFDQELNLTSEARHLLGITAKEADVVAKAAHALRDSIELAQSQTARARHYDPIFKEEVLLVEVDPLGLLLGEFTRHYQTQIEKVLGPERADFIANPMHIEPDHSVLYKRWTDGRYHKAVLVWSTASDGSASSYQSNVVKTVPDYVTEFLAMQEASE